MEWITGIQNAINYIEDHITEELNYEQIAKESFSSSFHFQRVFSILCGYTLGEYIRNRRLTLAGAELANTHEKIIDVALKYGYETPESFTKAFQKFHGITPSQARGSGAMLKSFSRLSIKVSLEGGSIMNYRIEQKEPLVLFGYKTHFAGSPKERNLQDHNYICDTRLKHAALQYMAHDVDTTYCVMDNLSDDGYDFWVASYLGEDDRQDLLDCFGTEVADWFEKIVIPAGTYLICETERSNCPPRHAEALYRGAVTQWLPSSGYELAEGPEMEVLHWPYKKDDEAVNNSRYMELWLPIKKK
jgi:AraC family transcriptional regulator